MRLVGSSARGHCSWSDQVGAPGRLASDDELYAWLVEAVDWPDQWARGLRDGVTEILLERVEDESPQDVELLFTRQQLRAAARSAVDILDDPAPDRMPPADDRVLAGLDATNLDLDLSSYLDEALTTRRRYEAYIGTATARLTRTPACPAGALRPAAPGALRPLTTEQPSQRWQADLECRRRHLSSPPTAGSERTSRTPDPRCS